MDESLEKVGDVEKEPALSFDERTMTVLLDAHLNEDVPLWLKERARQEGLSEKKEFHITIIGSKTGKKLLALMDSLGLEERSRVLKEIKELSLRFTWEFSLKEEYYSISKEYPLEQASHEIETRRSYIQCAELPDLAKFYKELSLICDLDSAPPFPHLTLFCGSTLRENELRGIGIYSQEQFEHLNPQRIAPETGPM